jgi:type I restriction enzyme R subunit
MSVETVLKFIQQGIVYDELSEEDRIDLENLYIEQNNELRRKISSYDSKISKNS